MSKLSNHFSPLCNSYAIAIYIYIYSYCLDPVYSLSGPCSARCSAVQCGPSKMLIVIKLFLESFCFFLLNLDFLVLIVSSSFLRVLTCLERCGKLFPVKR